MTNKIYDVLKWVALIGLPALSAFIFTCGSIWGFNSEPVIGTISALSTMVGAWIGVSTAAYNKAKKAEDVKVNPVDKE